jgi:hypothetical protein
MMYGETTGQQLTPKNGDESFKSLDSLFNETGSQNASKKATSHKRKYPEPINSDITRDHQLEMPGCYDRLTCLPVHSSKNPKQPNAHQASRQDYHECLKTWKYAQYHDECCFFHSIGALEGGENKHPEGCSVEYWPEDTRYYEGRQNYAQTPQE